MTLAITCASRKLKPKLLKDVDIMAELGLQAYCFYISWPGVMPTGVGKVNAVELNFYDRLVDGLLAKKITPFVMLYHWELPQALEDKGGWVNAILPWLLPITLTMSSSAWVTGCRIGSPTMNLLWCRRE